MMVMARCDEPDDAKTIQAKVKKKKLTWTHWMNRQNSKTREIYCVSIEREREPSA